MKIINKLGMELIVLNHNLGNNYYIIILNYKQKYIRYMGMNHIADIATSIESIIKQKTVWENGKKYLIEKFTDYEIVDIYCKGAVIFRIAKDAYANLCSVLK